MIKDLDKTLEVLLSLELPPELAAQVMISFATPDENFGTEVTFPAIDLFLYDVHENRELRSNEWLVDRQSDGTTIKQRSPVRVDCSYLVTAWPSTGAPNPVQDEHRMLSEVMRVLLRHPIIPDEILQGSLVGQEPSLPTITLQQGRLQSVGEFWQALKGTPKAVLHYTVTISVDAQKPVVLDSSVTDKLLKFEQGTAGA